ncbi:MAG: methyltransferase domain-containing protein [Actinomycetota bacterium]
MEPSGRRSWLVELLVCPACALSLREDRSALTCVGGHTYPVVAGIPRFTPPSTYADSFGFEWTSFPQLQLDTNESHESADTFRQKTGLEPDDVAGKVVLDAGCGMGRFTDVVARWGGARIVGADISRAVEAAAQNLAAFPSVGVVQADVRFLPFAPESFDIVFSIGVLHHTPNTFQSLARISRLVKPGGILAIWVYSRRLRRAMFGSEVIRPVTSRMRPEQLLRMVSWVTPRMRGIKRRLPGARPILDFVLPTSNHPNPEWQILDTFDWYSPRYQWKHTYDEIECWFRELGFETVERLEVPVAVRGRRPR